MRIGAFKAWFASALFGFSAPVLAGGPLSVCNGIPTKYPGAGTVVLNYDQGPLRADIDKAAADALVTAAVANWTNVATSTVTLSRGADLWSNVTAANYAVFANDFYDGLNPVIYDPDGSIIDAQFGADAKEDVLGFAGSAYSIGGGACAYLEGRAVISGFLSFIPAAELRAVFAHEMGHLIGMDHTQLDSDQGLTGANYPLMYPIAFRDGDTLHEDDAAAVTALYPAGNVNSSYGQLSGTLTLANGTTPVRGGNIWAVETTTGKLYSVVSDYLEQNTGFYKLLLPPGTYNLRVGAIRSSFTSGSSVGPYSNAASDASFLPPLYPSPGNRMTPVTLGGGTPTSITITAGCSATANWRIDGTGSVTGNCGHTLTVNFAGAGTGTVTSNPGGVSCTGTCVGSFNPGASVTLTATPGGGSTFGSWSGAGCTGTGTCVVSMASAQAVTATFNTSYTGSLAVRYRLYSPATLEHLYTTSLLEYQYLTGQVTPGCCGWVPEGQIYKLFSTPGSIGGVSAVPYYRLYNPFSFQHHWTVDLNEYNFLPTVGWVAEGPDGYILPTPAAGTVPLYRAYINAAGGLHLWTTDIVEFNYLTTQAGWVGEGIAGYVLVLP